MLELLLVFIISIPCYYFIWGNRLWESRTCFWL